MFIIIDRDIESTLSYRQRLYRNRIHSIHLGENEGDRIATYPAHAILLPHPELLSDPLGIIARLREAYPHLPIAAIHRQGGPNYYHLQGVADTVFPEKTTVPKMIEELYSLYEKKGNPSPTARITNCIRTVRTSPVVYVMGTVFLATHTQWMLVRYLNLAAPRAVPTEELLEVGFLPGRERSARNVGAQLNALDRVIERGFGFRVFSHVRPSSYRIERTFPK